MIKMQIIGNLGKDCIVKEVNGKTVINFSVAHTEKFRTADGQTNERTTWAECAYWTDRTAVADYLKKGKLVYVEGAPSADAFTNKENQPAATLRLRVQNLQLLGGNQGNDGAQGGQQDYASRSAQISQAAYGDKASAVAEQSQDEDLPF